MEKESLFSSLNNSSNDLIARQNDQAHLVEILHDDVIQIGCQIERSLRDLMDVVPRSSPFCATINEATTLTTLLVARLRDIVTDLYTPVPQPDDLFVALRALLQDAEQRTGLRCLLMTDPLSMHLCLEREQQRVLYTILRELVINTAVHAHAEWLRITISYDEKTMLLRVQDDGCGFEQQPFDELRAQGHFGLFLLEQRVAQMSGILHLYSVPTQGTTITMRIPLNLSQTSESCADLFVHAPIDQA